MKRSEHDRIVHEKDKTIARLERQNERLLARILFITGSGPEVALEAVDEPFVAPEPEVEHEDPDLPGWTSDPLMVGN